MALLRRCIVAAALIYCIGAALPLAAQEQVQFEAGDGLSVTADLYRQETAEDAPWIVLAHMAGSSRGEYRDIAPKLNELGFNAIALDQRSGGSFAGVGNETAKAAAKLGKAQDFAAAEPDILAGIAWAKAQNNGPVILWGSSYSAALALIAAGEQPDLVDGVIAISPGEYIQGQSVEQAASHIDVPVFIASAAGEKGQWTALLEAVPNPRKYGFAPASGCRHGSSSFIPSQNDSAEQYWQAVEPFLAEYAQD